MTDGGGPGHVPVPLPHTGKTPSVNAYTAGGEVLVLVEEETDRWLKCVNPVEVQQ